MLIDTEPQRPQGDTFGYILRTVYAVKAEAAKDRTEKSPVPEKVIIFVDELNKYAASGKENPITLQV